MTNWTIETAPTLAGKFLRKEEERGRLLEGLELMTFCDDQPLEQHCQRLKKIKQSVHPQSK